MPVRQDAVGEAGVIPTSVDLRRFPWIRPLVTAYADDFASVAPLFAGNPSEPAAWRTTIARVQRSTHDRALLRSVLTRQLERRGAPAAARAAAHALGDPTTVAVVTGQQAGAFGGPLYTLLKAITALQLARDIRSQHGVPATAVFWVDAEDHDWDEIRTATILDRDAQPTHVTLTGPPGAGSLPVGSLSFDASIDENLAALQAALPPTEFTSGVIDTLRHRYKRGATPSEAFAGWLDDLAGACGLVVFEANDPAVKPIAARIFAEEIAHPSRTAALVRDAAAEMTALGHAPQLDPSENGVCLFYLDGTGRHPVKRDDGGYVVAGVARSVESLREEALAHPERFSPNVMLRPLVQDVIFPTVCYVAGPAELAYQAQLGGVYRALGVETPLLYSRASATVLDSAAARFFERADVPFESLQSQDESALNRLLERELPASIDGTIDATTEFVAGQAARLKDIVSGIDPTLAGVVDTTVDRVRETLKTLQGKIVQASKKKNDTLRRQFLRTRSLVFPEGHPQERALNVAFFANRYGPDVAARLLEVIPRDTNRHFLLTL